MTTVTSQTWNDDFTFAGSNDLDMGTGAVTLSGTSRTVTVNANRLTVGGLNGGTTTALVVNGAGTLAIGNSTVAGLSGNGTIANNAAASATLTVNMSGNSTYSGVLSDGISNTLAFTKQGDGTLTLTNASTYTGNTSIQGGTVVMSNGQALGAVTSANTVRFSNAAPSTSATLDMATNGVGDNVYRVMVGSGSLVNIVSDRATPGPGIDHALTTGSDSVTDTLGGATINFTSGANVTSGTASVSFDQLNMSSGGAGTTVLNPTTARVSIGSVTKNRNAAAQTLELSGTNSGNQITGAISNGSAIVSLSKSGTSTWTLSGDSSYTGPTTVGGGTLLVNGNNSSATGGVTVSAGGILGGTGTIGSTVTMQAGSTFTTQFSAGTIDPLDIVGDLDLSALGNLLTVVGSGTSGPWTIINYSGTLTGTFESSPGYTVNYGAGSNSAITISFVGLPGDFNSDGKVDAGDYITWRKNQNTNHALANDNGLGTPIGIAHYNLWRANFGKPPGSGSGLAGASVPEPATWLLVAMASAVLTLAARRRANTRLEFELVR
jgi:autotransporter-associated beta strand protein